MLDGHGPCNRERLATRKRAHDEGEWVREAALAHARKRAAHSATPAAPTEQAA
ncbi:subunit of multicomponent oxygenase, phenylacetic acid degradation [Ralstonia solanacearum SD54]|nr:subunit of multicomponent oxygenase, phenylacetic acid degradation [Ralstonia solanacearum SD54]